MKKLLFFLLISVSVHAQSETFEIRNGFFSTTYLIGGIEKERTEVQLHLDKCVPTAGYQFRRAKGLSNAGAALSIVGCAGFVSGLVSRSYSGQLLGASVAVVGYSGAIVCFTGSTMKERRARRLYLSK